MLAARHYITPWPLENSEVSPRRPLSPRMSDHYGPSLSTQPEWHGDYTYSQHHEEVNFSHPFDRTHGVSQLRESPSTGVDKDPHVSSRLKEEGRSPHGPHLSRDNGQSPLGREISTALIPQAQHNRGSLESESLRESLHAGRGASANAPGGNSESDLYYRYRGTSVPVHDERFVALKEEDEDALDEDEVLDADGDQSKHPQTATERTAARRKMKRFRLTHQQTRFLMSEFVKQPHPDAAHRERLSREIPGLSPRQVQVWFQNRRAKIKRLNAEDRDRVIKMRAVPEDFDNIQALHSPYGAMNGLGAPLAATSELGNQHYGEHMARPLMVDVRRPEPEDNISPTGLTPAFEGVGFGHTGAPGPDLIQNMPSASSDRFPFGNHLQMGVRPRPSSTFPVAQIGKLDNGPPFGQQGMRLLQPLHLRESASRPRADSLHSPLRSGMSWKGETLDYSQYPMGSSTSPPLSDRQQSMYSMTSPSNVSTTGYGTESFSNNSAFHSPTGLEYSNVPHNSQNRPRLRAASATFPLSLDVRHEYRPPMPSQSPVHAYSARNPGTSSQYTSPTIYTTSYPPAPLTAPINMSQQRTSNPRDTAQDHTDPKLSATLNGPNEYPSTNSHNAAASHAEVSPSKDSFTGGQNTYGQSQEKQHEYGDGVGGSDPQRKASFAMPITNAREGSIHGPQSFDQGTT